MRPEINHRILQNASDTRQPGSLQKAGGATRPGLSYSASLSCKFLGKRWLGPVQWTSQQVRRLAELQCPAHCNVNCLPLHEWMNKCAGVTWKQQRILHSLFGQGLGAQGTLRLRAFSLHCCASAVLPGSHFKEQSQHWQT